MTTMAEHLDDAGIGGTDFVALTGYLGSASGEDDRIVLWFAAAIEAADNYMAADFVDADDVDIDPPTETVIGVYEYVKALREYYPRGAGVAEVKTASLGEKYRDQVGAMAAYHAAIPYWKPWKTDLTTAGSI